MPILSPSSIPFVFHIILETPAAVAFALFPSATLEAPQPQAHAVIRQYALLLLTTVLISAVFASQSHDSPAHESRVLELEHEVAGALAMYHLGPVIRAVYKLRNRFKEGRSWRTPCLHLLSHGATGMALAGRALILW